MSTRSSAARSGAISLVGSDFASSALVWLLLVLFLVVVRLFITTVGGGLENDPRASLFDWPFIIGFGALGLVGVWFAHKTGYPAALDPSVSNRQRFLYPAAVGLILGLVLVGQEQITHGISLFLQQTGMEKFNAPFPGSILFYAGGAIIVEVLYRLFAIPFLLWLISSVLLGGRAQTPVFWVLAVITSFIEPVTQEVGLLAMGYVGAFALQFTTAYVFNFSQAVAFRRYGFLAAIVVRWAVYLVWHVGYGNLICQC